MINVTFDSSNANFHADYTFKNNCSNSSDLGIILPFADHSGYSERPENIILTREEHIINHSWVDFPFDLNDYIIDSGLDAILFNLMFSANEEITIHVEYSRKYLISRKYGCRYRYLVGTARSWNHSLESAFFEFWIPKKLCTNLTRSFDGRKESYSDYFYNETRETEDYIVANIHFQDWIPDEDLDMIYVSWDRSFPPDLSFFLPIAILFVLTFGIIGIVLKRITRK
jgi:hypothetical protein